ncbi:SMI1/KNR4 family protein [Kitasatospora sp. NPDC002227]|uniref:SMI1/KNR4 family protein n=1 Tax=Kitasatospora sp. NPDC002227 TaxID=3154773 RepID=UPI00332B369F
MIDPPKNVINPVIPPVAASWKRIDAWLAQHAPASFAALRPPATPDAIARAESLIGIPLPSDLRESLLCHNGDVFPGALPCGPLYPVEEVVAIRLMRMGIWEPDDADQLETPWWGMSWVPFAGGDGDDHFIDAGPGTWHNHLGYAAHDDQGYFLGWPTFGVWLHHVADAMEHFERRESFGAVSRPTLTDDGEVDW